LTNLCCHSNSPTESPIIPKHFPSLLELSANAFAENANALVDVANAFAEISTVFVNLFTKELAVSAFFVVFVNIFTKEFAETTHIEELDELLQSRRKCQNCEKISIVRSCVVMVSYEKFDVLLPIQRKLCWRCTFNS